MFKIESYVTPILLSYVDKYVRDFKPADAQVSLWGGGVVLHNLVLKADVLQSEVALPFTLVSGRIHELLIQVPWTKIMSESIIITIDTIECVLSLNPPPQGDSAPPEPQRRNQVVEAPPGYMQALVRRIVSNIALRVHHLIVKYVQDDIVLSLNVKHLAVDSAGPNWEPAFADIEQAEPMLRRLVRLDDLTLCLDRADADGKIRFYQEPLLYRCQLDLRVLSRLVSASTRRASNLSVQLRSSKLAWGVSSDQLVLLLRLVRESPKVEVKPPPPPKMSMTQVPPLHSTSSNTAEPARQESWSEWAWSWLPAWADREGGAEELPSQPSPIPVHLTAFLDDVSLVFKVMELDSNMRKRARGVLELSASHAAVKSSLRAPTVTRLCVGLRTITLCSRGKCVCGHISFENLKEEPTIYLSKAEVAEEEKWSWPDENLNDCKIEVAQDATETLCASPLIAPEFQSLTEQPEVEGTAEITTSNTGELDPLWVAMEPVLFLEFCHERSPPGLYINPYDNPPTDFQYSDWAEVCTATVQLRPMTARLCTGLLHRLNALQTILAELPSLPVAELPTRTLTIEECDSLLENLPQRRVTIDVQDLRVRLVPHDHVANERATSEPPLTLDLDVPKAQFVVTGPLYPHRVCSAACQLPLESGPIWKGARLHVTGTVTAAQVQLRGDGHPKPCARTDLRFVVHSLLHQQMFSKKESIIHSYSLKIREASLCGSLARLQAAAQVAHSLTSERASVALQHTTLATDALNDEESVAIEMTFEELSVRGYLTKNINTHILSMQSARATAHHAPRGGEVKQAWLFAAPDHPSTTPYLRFAVQWCKHPMPNSLDYVGMWTEPISFCADPLFIAWLAYRPNMKPNYEPQSKSSKTMSSHFVRKRATPPSSSKFGSRSGSGAELVHIRPRSVGSGSEPSAEAGMKESKIAVAPAQSQSQWWCGDRATAIHNRLRHTLVSVELGLVLVYLWSGSASALDSETVRDAIERHREPVLQLSLGRISMHSNTAKKHLWQEIRHDGPTFIIPSSANSESFPWKLRLADVSCYTLQTRELTDHSSRERSAGGLRSQLKTSGHAVPKTVLEMVTTTVTLSVVTKSMQIKTAARQDQKSTQSATFDEKTKYFTTGVDFKPSTLKEFFRGPAKRKKSTAQSSETSGAPPPPSTPQVVVTAGPMVSLGVHIHADTPPIVVRLDHEQVHLVAAAVHGLQHILTLLQRPQSYSNKPSFTSQGGSHRTLIRSVSEIEELRTPSEESKSENASELISIFESYSVAEPVVDIKTFFWFQWVVSRATVVVATHSVKLAFDVDDIISTVDLQSHYNQLKVKIASASVRHYERVGSDEWVAGILGGRVLEAREPTNSMEDNHFMSITITQAQISNLPANWKEEMHPKLVEDKSKMDTMWEIYATLAPLEVLVQPAVLDNVMRLAREFAPRSFCPLQVEEEDRSETWQWPFCYVTAGGLRLLLTSEEEQRDEGDDTFIFQMGKVTVSPHPENPICRRAVNAMETCWVSGGLLEGRQYEVLVENCALRSAQLRQIVSQEVSEDLIKGTSGENPALKWTQPVVAPIITPMLHPVDIGCVFAPAMFVNGVMVSGHAAELNLVSDCSLEASVHQLGMLQRVLQDALRDRPTLFFEEKCDVCPYATLLMEVADDLPSLYNESEITDETIRGSHVDVGPSVATDSGVDTVTSHSTKNSRHDDVTVKKSVSITFADNAAKPSEYLEVFVTMGVIDISVYVADDGSPEVAALRLPDLSAAPAAPAEAPPNVQINVIFEESQKLKADVDDAISSGDSCTKSLTDTNRTHDVGKSRIDVRSIPRASLCEGNVPLLHITLHQPNLYYWRRKAQKSFQVSLFNAWAGLGYGQIEGYWNAPLITTTKGVPDPVTDIPPALATMKLTTPATGNARGLLRLDVERPVQLEVCTDRLRRLKEIAALIQSHLMQDESDPLIQKPMEVELPFLYRLRQFLVVQSLESVTVQTSQLSVCGSEGTVGCDSLSAQVTAGGRPERPERVQARALLTALLVAVGPPGDRRHLLLQPTTLGTDMEAVWDAWRRAEGGAAASEPTVQLCLDLDRLIVEIRPCDLAALDRLKNALATNPLATDQSPKPKNHGVGVKSSPKIPSKTSFQAELSDHYYKDDLRSGAFKLVSGGQLPMAYQVTVHGQSVAWRYPHPRAITRIVAFPLPDQEQEIECVLEFYSPILGNWHSYSFFNIPSGGPTEMQLYIKPPDAVFAQMWRFRPCGEKVSKQLPFEFDITRYMPRTDPLLFEVQPDMDSPRTEAPVSAEQLSGVVRVDSYFAPRALPLTLLAVRMAAFELHLHNSLPALSSQATALEGYYVSKPLMRSHRVLSVNARDATMYGHLGAPAGYKVMLAASVSSDILDCATGTMELLAEEFRLQLALSVPEGDAKQARVRSCVTAVRLSLHVPVLRTMRALIADWQAAARQYLRPPEDSSFEEDLPSQQMTTKRELWAMTASALEGRVSLWVHNSCARALRIGQEGTDELVPLGPGARLAYRWRSPTAQKKLRVAFAGPTTDWHWSTSVPFTAGSYRVRLEDAEALGSTSRPGGGVYAHIRVDARGAQRTMHLAGRLALANMLRFNLLYKVRSRTAESVQWHTVCSGELESESVGRSVVCGADCETALKIKFTTRDTGWSGDIPLKECPKENVPWLVKVPSEGEVPYISVWCRVVRARSDGRVLATVWPLYVLYSHLPLDTDVLISTESSNSLGEGTSEEQPVPLVQTAPGRGTTTHLIAPGTTAARHSLSFQYKNIECPVTREEVPLHYGVTDTSVFDKRAPVNSLEEVVQDILGWLQRSGRSAKSSWPYSLVAAHWPGEWQPAMLQPRCDVTVRYQAVRAGGGCCLELQLCPIALLCNATPIVLTLRAHDAAPLCKLEPGTAISPPSAVLEKPFFISLEVGRETFVSGQLTVSSAEPGRYGTPPPGHLALGHPAPFAIHCNQKVALLTMYYEIKQEINVLGASTTYELINMLDTDVLVSAIAVPNEPPTNLPLRPKTFKVVSPSKEMTVYGTPLCRFWLSNWWHGGDPSELTAFLCVALPSPEYPAAPVPVRLGCPPYRRSFALVNSDNTSVPVVVTQVKHDGRWLVTVARDPCPQFLVYNRTGRQLVVAQPQNAPSEPSTSFTVAEKECPGANWWLVVDAGKTIHYSSPQHCARYPPPARPPDTMQLLTFARHSTEDLEPFWCPPVAITDGEQLVQLHGGTMLKLHVHTHPHSTLLELKDVAQTDISASDIRKRLLEPYILKELKEKLRLSKKIKSQKSSVYNLERSHADANILEKSLVIDDPGEGSLDANEEEIDVMLNRGQSELTSVVGIQGNSRTVSNDHRSVTLNDSRIHSDNRKASKIDEREPDNAADQQTDASVSAVRLPKSPPPQPSASDRQPDSSDAADRQPVSSDAADRPPDSSKAADRQPDLSDAADQQPESSDAVDRQSVNLEVIKELSATPLLAKEKDEDADQPEASFRDPNVDSQASFLFQEVAPPEWQECSAPWPASERVRFIAASLSLELGTSAEAPPLLALHLDRAALLLTTDDKGTKTTISIAGVQIDNLQYDSGQYDFAVVASTPVVPREPDRWPSVWSMLVEHAAFGMRAEEATALLHVRRDWWTLLDQTFNEITEVELSVSPLALYVEDAYVSALVELARLALPATPQDEAVPVLAEMRTLQRPLRLQALLVHPLQLTLTLHTAVRMYIALDQSPLRLGAFRLKDVMTSVERLTHALTVHYLSAAILGAGWVVGGLELLGAPGALAARVGGAGGGVRGVAAAAAAALVRSLAACAGSLARNLDLLAGDEEHARRAAAARRSNPPSLAAGLLAGITNFAINILGAVGGLAHHPLVGVAVGETESGAAALRRGLVGALTKPLSATADLVAFAGRGLLTQAGWDPAPQPRESRWLARHCDCAPLCSAGWRRDCVRWAFRLAELSALSGFEVLLNNAPLNLLLTHKLLVVAEPETERIVEMIDLRFCTLAPYEGQVIELCVTQRRMSRNAEARINDEDDEYQISTAAMARVARYTGAEGAGGGGGGGAGGGAGVAGGGDARTLSLLPGPGRALALHAALAAAVHHNCDAHFPLL